MAERRMFTKKITDDDNFVMLSSSAQALYFHLSMQADDDGFCNQINASMFKAHASVEDLKSLLEKRYIYQFDDGVIVIKHWRMANALRKDRYTPTAFQGDFSKLEIKENGSYTLKECINIGCRSVAACLPQDRLGKDSIDKDSKKHTFITDERKGVSSAQIEKEFDELWNLYPRKEGKQNALKHYIKARDKGVTYEKVKAGILSYIECLKREQRPADKVKIGSTWFCQHCWEDEYTSDIVKKPTTKDIASAYDYSDF